METSTDPEDGAQPTDTTTATEGDDLLVGTDENDFIDGLAGNDIIFGGLMGDDSLVGGSGDDSLYAQGGDDIVDGGIGDDRLFGGLGNDTLIGGDGSDSFVVNIGGTTVIRDFNIEADGPIGFNNFGDLIFDPLDPLVDLNSLPLPFSDFSELVALASDTENGVLIEFPDGGSLLLEGLTVVALSEDNFIINSGPRFVPEPLPFITPEDVPNGTGLTVVGENITGSDGDNRLIGGDGNDTLDGGDGDDVLFAGLFGNDVLIGGRGDDTLYAQAGDDRLNGGSGDDILFGGSGKDTLVGGIGSDRFVVNIAGDTIIRDFEGGTDEPIGFVNFGDTVFNPLDPLIELNVGPAPFQNFEELLAAASNTGEGVLITFPSGGSLLLNGIGVANLDAKDFIFPSNSGMTLSPPPGETPTNAAPDDAELQEPPNAVPNQEAVTLGDGDDRVLAVPESNIVDAGAGDDTVFGGNGNDTLFGGDGDDQLFGGNGNLADDFLDGGNGDDTLFGGSGDDTIVGGEGEDAIYGGRGDDVITSGNGSDTLFFAGNHGNDTVTDFDIDEDILYLSNAAAGFTSLDDILAASAEITRLASDGTEISGLLIDTGDGNSVFLSGVGSEDLTDANITL